MPEKESDIPIDPDKLPESFAIEFINSKVPAITGAMRELGGFNYRSAKPESNDSKHDTVVSFGERDDGTTVEIIIRKGKNYKSPAELYYDEEWKMLSSDTKEELRAIASEIVGELRSDPEADPNYLVQRQRIVDELKPLLLSFIKKEMDREEEESVNEKALDLAREIVDEYESNPNPKSREDLSGFVVDFLRKRDINYLYGLDEDELYKLAMGELSSRERQREEGGGGVELFLKKKKTGAEVPKENKVRDAVLEVADRYESNPEVDLLALMNEVADREGFNESERSEMASFLGHEIRDREEEARTKKLYEFIKKRGRSGVVTMDDGQWVRILGKHKKGDEFVLPDEHEEKVRGIPIEMDGKNVGTLKIFGEGRDAYEEFEPAPGVEVFDAEELEKEMERSGSRS
jgi:hypothetical protein